MDSLGKFISKCCTYVFQRPYLFAFYTQSRLLNIHAILPELEKQLRLIEVYLHHQAWVLGENNLHNEDELDKEKDFRELEEEEVCKTYETQEVNGMYQS